MDGLFVHVDDQSFKVGQIVHHPLDTLSQGHKNTGHAVTGQSGHGHFINASYNQLRMSVQESEGWVYKEVMMGVQGSEDGCTRK